jgi:hypothetical protein
VNFLTSLLLCVKIALVIFFRGSVLILFLCGGGVGLDVVLFRSMMLMVFFFLNSHSGGWSPNWVHSARRPLTGLLYLPRVIVKMENLVE